MRRVLLLAVIVATVVAAILIGRRMGAEAGGGGMGPGERFFERMPDSFPPKRMAAELERIRKQNEEILEMLKRRVADTPDMPPSGP